VARPWPTGLPWRGGRSIVSGLWHASGGTHPTIYIPVTITFQPDDFLPGPLASPAALPGWQQVHRLLAARAHAPLELTELVGLSTYYYFTYKELGMPLDAALAQRLLAQLAQQLAARPAAHWPAPYFDHARAVAWLAPRLEQHGFGVPVAGPLLASLDQELSQLTQRWHRQPDTLRRPAFFQAVRYAGLRYPAPAAAEALHYLLAAPLLGGPALHWPPGEQPLALGLGGGLAAELLVLMGLARGASPQPALRGYVREGVQQILALKRAIDFPEQHYGLFPYQVHAPHREPAFSTELSWRRGDLGQALLLYNASDLFGDAELAKIAELVGLNTLLRTTGAATHVASAGFERGAAGVAHLYGRLYRASNYLPKYRQGYLTWLGETQRWLAQELATDVHRQRAGCLPTGLAGSGLVLLAAATGTAHDWDTVLL